MTAPAASGPIAGPPPGSGWGGIALVSAVALIASVAGLANGYAFDDVHIIQLNPRLHGLGQWREILTSTWWPPPWNEEHYRPVTSLLLAAQHGIGGGAPIVFRITSYLLYAVTSVFVLLLARRMLPAGVALAAALLFAAHPVHVETVAQAVSQGELLVGLLGVAMVVRYLDRRRGGGMRRRDWGLLAAGYLVASLAKEHGMVIVALLVAAEVLLVRGPAGERARRLWPGYASLALVAAGLVLLRLSLLGGRFSGNWIGEGLETLSFWGRALTALSVVPEWARLLVWPVHLRADYSPQELVVSTGFGGTEALGLAIVVASATVAGMAARRGSTIVAFGLAWMAITLLPVTNVIVLTSALLAERQLFLPSVGFVLALGGILVARRPADAPARVGRTARAAVAVLVVAGLARSAERQRIWRSDAFFVVRSVQDAPRSYRMQRAYGDLLFALDRPALARDAYQRAIALAPGGHGWRVRNELARRLRERGETGAEVEQLMASLAEESDQDDTRGYLIVAHLALGDYAAARREADTALVRAAPPVVFEGLRALADSAARVGAPPGSIRVRLRTGPAER